MEQMPEAKWSLFQVNKLSVKRTNQNATFFYYNLSFIHLFMGTGDRVKLTFIRSTNTIGYIQLIC